MLLLLCIIADGLEKTTDFKESSAGDLFSMAKQSEQVILNFSQDF